MEATRFLPPGNTLKQLQKRMDSSPSYEDWLALAQQQDTESGAEE